jgi:hypothetical protein
MYLFRHAGPEEHAPYSDTGASRRRPDESREPSQRLDPGVHREPWIPVFAGMTILFEAAIYKQTLFNSLKPFHVHSLIVSDSSIIDDRSCPEMSQIIEINCCLQDQTTNLIISNSEGGPNRRKESPPRQRRRYGGSQAGSMRRGPLAAICLEGSSKRVERIIQPCHWRSVQHLY